MHNSSKENNLNARKSSMSIIVWMRSYFPDPFCFLCDGFENIILQVMIYLFLQFW